MNKFRMLILLAACSIASCGVIETKENRYSDLDLKTMLVGVWANKEASSNQVWGYDSYFSDGTIHSVGYYSGEFDSLESKWFYIFGYWKVKNGASCFTSIKGENVALDLDVETCSEIVSIEQNKVIFRGSNGSLTTLYKVSDHTVQ